MLDHRSLKLILRMSLSEFCGERLSFVAISFYCCRYFLGHVACRNLPLQGLISVAYSPLQNVRLTVAILMTEAFKTFPLLAVPLR